ncbi:MAG: alpha-ketoacid dehydrogenase subunit beta, partial [Microbacterium sp.]
MPISRALNAGLRAALAGNDRVLLMGEDIGKLGGVFRVTEGLQADFGDRRVLDTPLAESGIVGTAIGLAMAGFRPVCEIQFDGFVFPAFDQITSQLAKITNRHEGALQMPVVIRIPYGGHIGAVEHHQESPEAYFTHTPGLRVVSPSTPNDAYWMIQDAIASNDPVMFFEPKSRYWPKADVDTAERRIGMHTTQVVREGTEITLLGYGPMVNVLLAAADIAAEEGT